MHIATYIVIGIVLLILAGSVIKLVYDKKKGVKCPGCPGCANSSSCADCSQCDTQSYE